MENGTIVYIPQVDIQDHFSDVIRLFENVILSGNDLFISTPLMNNQSKK